MPERERLFEEALQILDRANALPGGDASALVGKASMLRSANRYPEAEAAIDEAIKLRTALAAYQTKINLLLYYHGDLDQARTFLLSVPAAFWQDGPCVATACRVWLWRREPQRALTALRNFSGDYFEGRGSFTGPKDYLTGLAHQMTNKPDAAQTDWRAALQVIDRRLTTEPNATTLHFWKACLQACLHETVEAERALRIFEQHAGTSGPRITQTWVSGATETAVVYLLLGHKADVLDYLEARHRSLSSRMPGNAFIFRNRLRLEPTWDPLRGDPRFEALLREP